MFLLVSGRHFGAHPDGHQHGVSIQTSINLGKKFLRISCIKKIDVTWNLARVFAYLPSFYSQTLDLTYWTVLIVIWIYFEWRDTEKHQLAVKIVTTQDISTKRDNCNCFDNSWLHVNLRQKKCTMFLTGIFLAFSVWVVWSKGSDSGDCYLLGSSLLIPAKFAVRP